MNDTTEEEIHSPPEEAQVPRMELSGLSRGLALFAGVILPAICFFFGCPNRPLWQSQKISDYAQLFLSHAGSAPFYPLLLYNMASMVLMVCHPHRYLHNVWVRWGIYSGVAVALGFWGLFMVALGENIAFTLSWGLFVSLLSSAVSWGMMLAVRWMIRNNMGILLTVLIGLFFCLILFIPIILVLLLVIASWSATAWAVTAYGAMSLWIIRQRGNKRFQFSLAQLLGVMAWVAGYCSAWRIAYLIVLEKYAQLPTKPPPQCYLCTAAARGHRRWVGSEELITPDGSTVRVNDQLRTFKAFELLLQTVCPGFHRLCRKIYNAIGPILAATIRHPMAADAAYTLLKPAEWICRGLLRLVLNDPTCYLEKLYRS
jgi:hypothetical protein